MGISLYPEDGPDTDSLNKHANIALTRSKDMGRNRYLFYSLDMYIQDQKQFILRNDLHRVVQKSQLLLHFQPLVDLRSHKIVAAEALVRWEHPTWGIISPDEFITIAEETGLIVDIGKWVLDEVCRIYKRWVELELPPIKVSINLSAFEFYDKHIVDHIKNTIEQYGLEPGFLILEIVERVLIDNVERVVEVIGSLHELGIRIALDDFGTGFSSLEYLNKFNIDIIKIDQNFIKSLPGDEISSIITKSVIQMARELKIKLVAEGIERYEQYSYLKKLNCGAGQGFLFSKPVPQQDFERILARVKCVPVRAYGTEAIPHEERRKFFRVRFPLLLEADMSIVKMMGKNIKIGAAKVVVKNMGPGGLCFVSNIRLPVKRDSVFQLKTELLGEEIKVLGTPVWMDEIEDNLYEYGIQFSIDENDRMELIRILNQYQIKLRNHAGFNEGKFVSGSLIEYFNQITTGN